MATVNYSVPDEVKDAFNKQFRGRNKSAIVAELMRKAVEDARLQDRRSTAIREILEMRKRIEPMADEQIRQAREEGHS